MRIAVIGGYGPSLINFRKPLLKALISAGHEVFGLAPLDCSDVPEKLAEMGIKYIEVPIQRTGMNPAKDFASFLTMIRILHQISPDVTLSYTIKPVIYGSIAAKLTGVKSIYSMITGLGYAFGKASGKRGLLFKLVKNLYRIGLSANNLVMFQNQDDRDLFKKIGIIPQDKKTVVTNGSGVDLKHYIHSPVPEGGPVFLCISRLLKEKGVCEFAAASINLKEKYPQAQFRLVGPHDHGPDSINADLVTKWQEGGIEYLGQVDDVRDELKKCSVYVLPSYREGTPRSVLEAMATGRAIVTTDATGCRETVHEGRNGFMVPVKDVAALQLAMEKFIYQPDLMQSMGAASLEYVTDKFDVNKVNETIMKAMGL